MLFPALQRLALLSLPFALTVGCQSGASRALPDPLPEVLGWDLPQSTSGPYLGLEVTENDSGSLDDLFFAPGVRVRTVATGSPAAGAGFQPGDVVLEVAEEETNDPTAFLAAVRARSAAGQGLQLEVQRGDAVFDLEVVPTFEVNGQAPPEQIAIAEPARTLARWQDSQHGAGLASLHPSSPLARIGLAPGMVVTHLDGAPIRSARSLVRQVTAAEPEQEISWTWRRADGNTRTASCALYSPPRVLLSAWFPFVLDYEHDPSADTTRLNVLDLWLLWLVRYERLGLEQRWSVLRIFEWSSGVGELGTGAGS